MKNTLVNTMKKKIKPSKATKPKISWLPKGGSKLLLKDWAGWKKQWLRGRGILD